MSIRIVTLPDGLPKGWDLADKPPFNIDIKKILSKPKRLIDHILSVSELSRMDIPPKKYFIENIIAEHSLTMLYAERGLGKTWAVMTIAISVAHRDRFLAYKVNNNARALIVDGEMALSDVKGRFEALEKGITDKVDILSSEYLYREDKPLNFADPTSQALFIEMLEEQKKAGKGYGLLIFDNLSSLLSGLDENDNTDMEGFLQYLIRLRHLGYGVLLVHHAGKSGDQRGGSRREDLLDTVMKLETPDEKRKGGEGAHFILKFTKTRGMMPSPAELDVKLDRNDKGRLEFTFHEPLDFCSADEILRLIHDENPDKQKDIAEMQGVTSGAISQALKQLRENNYLSPKGLTVTKDGEIRLLALWPDEYPHLAQQKLDLKEEEEVF